MLDKGCVDDFWNKISQLRRFMQKKKIDQILMTKVVNFYWLTGGRSFVSIASEEAVGKILVTMSDVYLITTNNEISRLLEEELKTIKLQTIVYPWYESFDKNILLKYQLSNEFITDSEIEKDLLHLRSMLTSLELNRLRWLGKISAQILEQECRTVEIGDQENEVAARLSSKFWQQGIEPLVLNIGADQRAYRYRHPIATNYKIKNHLACSICVRKWGLHVTLTRIVHFGQVDAALADKHHAAMTIDSIAIANTCAGRQLNDITSLLLEAYKERGYEEEWKAHPIGGLIGFKPREFDVIPDMTFEFSNNQAFCWNPTIQGTKSEDTIIVTSEGAEIITHSGEFDYIKIKVGNDEIKRADILVRDI